MNTEISACLKQKMQMLG